MSGFPFWWPAPVCVHCGRKRRHLVIFYALMHPCPGDCRNSTDPSEQAMLEREGFTIEAP